MVSRDLRINNGIRLLNNRFKVEYNSIRLNTGNTLIHELSKCKVGYILIKNGKKIVTEAIFSNGSRADIYVPEDYRVYEILHSETEAMAKEKLSYYLEELDLVFLKSEDVMKDDFLL